MALSPDVFFAISTIVGVAQVLDAALIKKGNDENNFAATTLVFSLIEYVWAYICYQNYSAELIEIPLWHPLSFLIYVAIFFAIGLVLAAKGQVNAKLLPAWAVTSGKIFGIYFAASSAFLWLTTT
jgi:hypothetical protein